MHIDGSISIGIKISWMTGRNYAQPLINLTLCIYKQYTIKPQSHAAQAQDRIPSSVHGWCLVKLSKLNYPLNPCEKTAKFWKGYINRRQNANSIFACCLYLFQFEFSMTDDNGDNYKYGNDDAWSVGKRSIMNVVVQNWTFENAGQICANWHVSKQWNVSAVGKASCSHGSANWMGCQTKAEWYCCFPVICPIKLIW